MCVYFQKAIGKLILFTATLLLFQYSASGQTFNFASSEASQKLTGSDLYTHGLPDTVTTWCNDWDRIQQNYSSLGDSFKLKSNNSFVKFRVEDLYLATDYNTTINYTYRVAYTAVGYTNVRDTVHTFTTTNDTLTISYNDLPNSTPYQNLDLKKYSNYYKLMVVVNAILVDTGGVIAPANLTDTAWRNFNIEASILTQHYEKNPYGITGGTPSIIAIPITGNNYVDLAWDTVTANRFSPVNYELEWTYVDDYDVTPAVSISTSSLPTSAVFYNFNHNSTRVWLDSNGYRLPLTYPSGYVIYRVRYVRPDSALFKYPVYSAWSGDGGTSLPDSGFINSLAGADEYQQCTPYTGDSLNWQYTVSFAEGGKYKQVASFYDGLLKNRQSITRFNSNLNQLIATDNVYDFEGRTCIKTLPAPVSGVSSFSYLHNIDLSSVSHVPFQANDFDTGFALCPTIPVIAPLDSTALASVYYSHNNPDQSGAQQYVPDAQGYPFVQTIFEPGFTDRVQYQGGTGPRLQIGDTNFISNTYVSPMQMPLNALFGSNIGWSNYYRMTVSSDPNQQLSMVIKDYDGRQMASAMIGAVDTITHALRTISVPNAVFYTQDLLHPSTSGQVIDNTAGTITASTTYYNEAQNTDSLEYIYSLAPYEACNGMYISVKSHFNCWVTDQCGNFVMHNDTALGTNGVTYAPTPLAYTNDAGYFASTENYNVKKTLSFYPSDIQAALDSFFNVDSCFLPENYFIRQSIDSATFPCPDTGSDAGNLTGCSLMREEMMQQLYPGAVYGACPTDSLGAENSIFTLIGCPFHTFIDSSSAFRTTTYDCYSNNYAIKNDTIYVSAYDSAALEYDTIKYNPSIYDPLAGAYPNVATFWVSNAIEGAPPTSICVLDSFSTVPITFYFQDSLNPYKVHGSFIYASDTSIFGEFTIIIKGDIYSVPGTGSISDSINIISDGAAIGKIVSFANGGCPFCSHPDTNAFIHLNNVPISHGIINYNLTDTLPGGVIININIEGSLASSTSIDTTYLENVYDSTVTNIHSPLCHYRYQDTCLVPNLDSITVGGIKYTDLRTMPVDSFIMIYNGAIAEDNDTIAEALLPLHPQYCELQNCFNDTFKTQMFALPNWQVAASLNLLMLDSIIAQDPVKTLLATKLGFVHPEDSLRTFSGGLVVLDTFILMNAYCASNDSIMLGQCISSMFASEISHRQLINDAVKTYYFNYIVNAYFSNRQQYVTELFMNGGNTCSHCALARMNLNPAGALFPAPPVSADSAIANDSTFGISTGWISNTSLDSITTLEDSSTALYNSLDSTFATGEIDTIIAHLANCIQGNTTLAIAIKDSLLSLYDSGEVNMGNFTYEQILHVLNSNGVTLSDLCNPYVLDCFQLGTAQPVPTANCKAAGFYSDMTSFMNNAAVLGSFSDTNHVTSFTLNTSNTYESSISATLGGATSVNIFASYNTGYNYYELGITPTTGGDTVKVFLHAGECGPIFSSGGSISVNVSCINTSPEYMTGQGLVNQYSFIAAITAGGATCTMPGWNDSVLTMTPMNNNIAMCIPCTQMRTLYTQFNDTMNSYGIYGTDHPYYNIMLSNFMNNAFQQQYSDLQYENFIQSCALADSMRMPVYSGYATYRFNNSTDMNSFISMLDNIDPTYSFDNSYRDSTFTDTSVITVCIDLSPVSEFELWQYKDTLNNYPGPKRSRVIDQPFAAMQRPGEIGFIYSSPDPLYAFNPADSNIIDTTGTVKFIGPYQKGIWIAGQFVVQNVYDIVADSTTPPYIISRDVYSLAAYIYNKSIPGAVFVPNYMSTINQDYFKPQKQAYLQYAYGLQQLPQYEVLDSLQAQNLQTSIPSYLSAGYQATYTQPYSINQPSNLYLLNTGMTNAYYDTLKHIIGLSGTGGYIFYNAASTTISSNLMSYICSDGSYWYRYFTTSDTLYNVYVSIPTYIPPYLRSSYFVAGNPIPVGGDSLNRYFMLNIVRTGTTDTVQVSGMTNFVFGKSIELDNVLLGTPVTGSSGSSATTDTFDNCERQTLNSAITEGIVNYYNYLDSVKAAISSSLTAHLLDSVKEQLLLGYWNDEFQYTLYNYDRAGNLRFTVPPAGVTMLANTGNKLNEVDSIRTVNADTSITPAYSKINQYSYNSLNLVDQQNTINGGKTRFMYDVAGRLIFSQNAKQAPNGFYTYNIYDDQNRIIETGEAKMGCPYFDPYTDTGHISTTSCHYTYGTGYVSIYNSFTHHFFNSPTYLISPDPYFIQSLDQIPYDSLALYIESVDRDDVVRTIYDTAAKQLSNIQGLDMQQNLRKRVSCVKYFQDLSISDSFYNNYNYATHYSYDIDGNVQTLTQDFPELASVKQQYKRIDYDYDLISGKVNMLSYNRGWPDQYYQQYTYDADNRITQVQTSSDGYIWQKDASYSYYQHGPLARVQLGDLGVQGVDYAYTIQGWLKVVNSDTLNSSMDMGGDGLIASVTAPDAVAYAIDYFKNDYQSISRNAVQHAAPTALNLFNGNIVRQTVAIDSFQRLNKQYIYDQLNRIKQANYASIDPVSTTLTGLTDFHNNYQYDKDGNLQALVRYGNNTGSGAGLMDSLIYQYNDTALGHNDMLSQLYDLANQPVTHYTNDIAYTGTTPDHYEYDQIGNTTKDMVSGQDTIQWNLYNKVTNTQNNASGNSMLFEYDGGGNRVAKSVTTVTDTANLVNTDYYVHDAQGNILAVYKEHEQFVQVPIITWVTNFNQSMRTIFGSSVAFNNTFVTPSFGGNTHFEKALLGYSVQNSGFASSELSQPASFFLSANKPLYTAVLNNSTAYLPALVAAQLAGEDTIIGPALTAMSGTKGDPGDFIEMMGNIFGFQPDQAPLFSLVCGINNDVSILQSVAINYAKTVGIKEPQYLVKNKTAKSLNCDSLVNILLGYNINGSNAVIFSSLFLTAMQQYSGAEKQYLDQMSINSFLYSDPNISPTMNSLVAEALTGYSNKSDMLAFFDGYSGSQALLDQIDSPSALLEIVYHSNPGSYINAFDAALGDSYIDSSIAAIPNLSYTGYVASGSLLTGRVLPYNPTTTVLKYQDFSLAEHDIYGSSRLGVKDYNVDQVGFNYQYNAGAGIYSDTALLWNMVPWYSLEYQDVIKTDSLNLYGNTFTAPWYFQHTQGMKQYELTDHLGDVLATVSDKRAGGTFSALPGSSLTAGSPCLLDTWKPVVVSAYDYYPFGEYMPGRYFSDTACHCYTGTLTELLPDIYYTSWSLDSLYAGGGWIIPIRHVKMHSKDGSLVVNTDSIGSGFSLGVSGLPVGVATSLGINLSAVKGTFTARLVDNASGTLLGSTQLSATQGQSSAASISFTGLSSNATLSITSNRIAGSSISFTTIQIPHDTMELENVVTTSCNNDFYRYGFNGQLKDNEWAGLGNHNTALFWEYDTRRGGRHNPDPVMHPWESPYSAFGDNPIWHSDLLGNDWTKGYGKDKKGTRKKPIELGEFTVHGGKGKSESGGNDSKPANPDVNATGGLFGNNGTYNIMQAANRDIGRDDASRANVDALNKAAMIWTGVGAAPFLGVMAPEAAPALASAVDFSVPKVGSYLFRARLASAASDLVAQGVNKGVGNINGVQTASTFLIGNPFFAAVPGSFVNFSVNSLYGNKPIFSPLNLQTSKSIMLGTMGNMLSNTMSRNIRGGLMQLGKPQSLFTEFLGQQVGHQAATAIDEGTSK